MLVRLKVAILIAVLTASIAFGQTLEPVRVVAFGSPSVDIVNELAYSPTTDELYVGGTISGPVTLPAAGATTISVGHDGDYDALVGVFDPNKSVFSDHLRIGGILDQYLSILLPRDNGDLMIGGAYKELTDFDADGTDGFTSASLEASFDPYLMLTSSTLEQRWIKLPFGELSDYAHSLQPMPDGGTLYSGMFRISLTWEIGEPDETRLESYDIRFDTAVVRFDSNGDIVWSKVLGRTEDDAYTFSTLLPDNSVVLCGFFEETTLVPGGTAPDAEFSAAGDRDIVACRLDADGNLIWARGFGGPGQDEAFDVLEHQSGALLMGGVYSDDAVFDLAMGGTQTLTSAGGLDCFIASLDPATGLVFWVGGFGGTADDTLYEMAEYSDGAILGGGFFGNGGDLPGLNGLITGRGGRDGYIGLFSPYTGEFYAFQLIGGAARDEVISVEVGPAGRIYAGGVYSGSCFFGNSASAPIATSSGVEDAYVLELQADLPADAWGSWHAYW